MKILISFILILGSSIGFSANREVFQSVLNSREISNVQNINKVEIVATYRCPNCFDFLITGTNDFGEAYVKVRTHQDMGGPLIIELIESSK